MADIASGCNIRLGLAEKGSRASNQQRQNEQPSYLCVAYIKVACGTVCRFVCVKRVHARYSVPVHGWVEMVALRHEKL